MGKEEFVQELIKKGLNAGFANDGVPTVFVTEPCDINKANKIVKDAIRQTGYTSSYGISQTKNKGE